MPATFNKPLILKEILLDTRIIIEHPNLLGVVSKDHILITTDDVIDEIRQSGSSLNISYTERLKLIENIVQLGNIKLISTKDGKVDEIKYSINSVRLNSKDKGIIAYILFKRSLGEEVDLATNDKMLLKFAPTFNIRILDKSQLDNLLINAPEKDQIGQQYGGIFNEIENFESIEYRRIRNGFLAGFALSLIAFLIYINIQRIISSGGVWLTISLLVLLSFTLYIIREKWRLPYGFLEFSVGIFSVWAVFFQNNFQYKILSLDANFFIRIIGGLYIMVRGIDNMMIATKDTHFALKFRKLLALNQ